MADHGHQLVLYHDELRRLGRRLEVMEQLHLAPSIYVKPEDLALLFAPGTSFEVTNQDVEASKLAMFFVLLLQLVIDQLKMLIHSFTC